MSYAEEVGVDLPDSLREIIDILFERSEQSSRQAWLERDEANGMYRRYDVLIFEGSMITVSSCVRMQILGQSSRNEGPTQMGYSII